MKLVKLGTAIVAGLYLASFFGLDMDLIAAILALAIALVDLGQREGKSPRLD